MITSGYMSDTIKLDNWQAVSDFVDAHISIKPSYFERAVQGNYPKDAFSKGQLASKAWLLSKLDSSITNHLPFDSVIAVLGCWIGTLVEPLLDATMVSRVYGIDLDPRAIELAEKFNQHLVQDDWRFKGVVADASTLTTSNMEFETAGELIRVTPKVVINTSCEHMDTHWFETANSDQLIIMQTNNSEGYDGHINICNDLADLNAKYPMSTILYQGQLTIPAYTRFMQIGYK